MTAATENGLGQWIKEQRKTRGLSLRELASLAGIAHSSLDKAERGGGMRADTLVLVVNALAGPDATEEEKEDILREARAASVGIELPEVERSVLMERFGGRYDGIAQYDDLVEVAESTMQTLLRQAQKRMAIGGTGEPKDKPEE